MLAIRGVRPAPQPYCRVPFSTGNSGSKPSNLAFPTAIAPEKGRFAPEKWGRTQGGNSRRQQPARQRYSHRPAGQEAAPDRLAAPRRPLAQLTSASVTAAYPGTSTSNPNFPAQCARNAAFALRSRWIDGYTRKARAQRPEPFWWYSSSRSPAGSDHRFRKPIRLSSPPAANLGVLDSAGKRLARLIWLALG